MRQAEADFEDVVPTHVGVNREAPFSPEAQRRCPHARGGEPAAGPRTARHAQLSPRTWG